VLLLRLCGCRRSSVSIFSIACGFLQVDLGLVLELPNKKAQSFLISIALNRLFSEHAHKMFDEISMMT
jgi:hypothetical protein